MKGTSRHWTLKLKRKSKNMEILHLSWATIPGMDRKEIPNPHEYSILTKVI